MEMSLSAVCSMNGQCPIQIGGSITCSSFKSPMNLSFRRMLAQTSSEERCRKIPFDWLSFPTISASNRDGTANSLFGPA